MQDEIRSWLRQDDPAQLGRLWRQARDVRCAFVGRQVHLRGLIEISSYCERACHYCGLRAANVNLPRYRMTPEEILATACQAHRRGYGTVVLQAGEDPQFDLDALRDVVQQIKQQTPLAVTLSLGERSESELIQLKRAGADRYLLRFETSNDSLLRRIHPPRAGHTCSDRMQLLRLLQQIGYEVGGGFMIGIPGQTVEDLVRDIQRCVDLGLDMIGIGPYIAHPDTPLGRSAEAIRAETEDQAPADALTTYKAIALCRLACPRSNIPCTSALATLDGSNGRQRGLQRGANVIMPNLTPSEYRHRYQIYPNKASSTQTPAETDALVRQQVLAAGQEIAQGRGDSRNWLDRSVPMPLF
jgi:biotin synthase